jgi:hypothetical protein
VDPVEFESRRRKAQGQWQTVAMVVPVSILVGELLYGTLSSMRGISWATLWQPLSIMVIVGLVLLRMARRIWLPPSSAPLPPNAAVDERRLSDAFKYLRLAWFFAALQALAGMAMMLYAAPRPNAYIFDGISIVYFLLYFPRLSFFRQLALTTLHR